MVVVAQLAELSVVVRVAAGSSPVDHPINKTVPICRDCFVLCVFFLYVYMASQGEQGAV